MSELILYTTDDGKSHIRLHAASDTVWLTQREMARLFNVSQDNIGLHLKNIYAEEELARETTTEQSSVVQTEGRREVHRPVTLYNLDAILAVGYRVRSPRGTQFRRWATTVLKEYLVKGFAMDDERLKNPDGRPDYFDELLERIRDIRASEKRMYLRVREIFALAADYAPGEMETTRFFQHMQDKLHYASTGHTAAELIYERADHTQPNMGLTSWKGDRVSSADVMVAKNYLKDDEIGELNRIITMWLDFAEDQARRRKQVFMADWQIKLDQFLQFHEREVLEGHGSRRRTAADDKAKAEYQRFAERRRAFKESQGENDTMRALESLMKQGDHPSSDN